jgi:hypothetical protein
LFFVLVAVITAGCGRGYRPSIIDIRDQPIYTGFDPTLPDVSQFILPVSPVPSVLSKPGFDYELAEQRRLNHLVKFQAQLREQIRRRVQ